MFHLSNRSQSHDDFIPARLILAKTILIYDKLERTNVASSLSAQTKKLFIKHEAFDEEFVWTFVEVIFQVCCVFLILIFEAQATKLIVVQAFKANNKVKFKHFLWAHIQQRAKQRKFY